jgi:hypothetical protein
MKKTRRLCAIMLDTLGREVRRILLVLLLLCWELVDAGHTRRRGERGCFGADGVVVHCVGSSCTAMKMTHRLCAIMLDTLGREVGRIVVGAVVHFVGSLCTAVRNMQAVRHHARHTPPAR